MEPLRANSCGASLGEGKYRQSTPRGNAMQVHDLVALLTKAADSSDPAASVQEAMETLKGDLPGLAAMLDYIPGTGGNTRQAFYRSPTLSLLKVSFPNSRRTPPHNHGTWATILLMDGQEKRAGP